MVHLSACLYQLIKDGPRYKGIVVLEAPGLASVETLLDSSGHPVTAPDGGSPDVWQYWLTPAYGAISIPTEG